MIVIFCQIFRERPLVRLSSASTAWRHGGSSNPWT